MIRFAALSVLIVSCLVVRGQDAPTGPTGPVSGVEVGHALVRAATIDLGMRPNPKPEDYRIAANALLMAAALRPGDAETARLAAAAAWGAGDTSLLLEATRGIIIADPADTVAQLRLISASINEHQTAESRLAAYDRFLGAQGAGIDPAVRSRLALDAALLDRELGNTDGFERRLLRAVELDMTNKDAVSLAARTLGQDASDIKEIMAWQVRLLYADPLDPHVHLTIARLCAGQGAMDSAARFLNNGITLFQAGLGQTPAALREEQLALLWQQEGPEAVLEALNPSLNDTRAQAAAMIKDRQEANEPHDDIKNPEDIRYDLGIEKIRLLASHAAGDEESLLGSLNDYRLSTNAAIVALGEAAGKPGADRGALIREMVRVFSDHQIMRGIVGREGDLMRQEIDRFAEEVPGAEAIAQRLEPWVDYAQGDTAGALGATVAPRPGTLDRLVVALASEKVGDTDLAAEIYSEFSRTRALDAYGALARTRLVAMGRASEAVSAQGAALESVLSRVPAWMDRMLTEARAFMMLQVDAPARTTGPLEATRIRVRLRNIAPIPLGLGASRPIGSRLLIAPRPVHADSAYRGEPTPRVIDLNRRLRLEPLEELEALVEADSAYTDWLRDVNAQTSLRDRYRVLQSFRPGPRGGLVNGPLALVNESNILQRTMLPLSRAPAEEIEAAIASEDPRDLRGALVATLSRCIEPSEDLELSADERTRLARAWVARFSEGTDDERALILLELPHAGQVAEMEAFDTAAVRTVVADALERAKAPETVTAALLLTRVRDPESPVFELAAQSGDARLRALGRELAQRLEEGRPSMATAGPGVAAFSPPVEALSGDQSR